MSLILSTGVDPILTKLVLISLGIIVLGFFLKRLKQPYIVAYILAGVIMGPSVLGIVSDESLISNLGSFGLVLLLFFIGMEISLPQLISNLKISVIGTVLQVGFSILAVWSIGFFLDWPLYRIILLGFVISISSTAVVIKLLQDRNETNSKTGQNVIGILLAQDVIIVPMLITLNYLSGQKPENIEVLKQVVGGCFMVGIIVWVMRKKEIRFPFDDKIKADHEMQVFAAIAVCFGFSVITAFLGLSSALGAFIAGILVSSAQATKWVHESLHAFRVVFVAIFFVSIGMLIDLSFLHENLSVVMLLVLAVFLTNNIINAVVLRILGVDWRSSIYSGAILAQIGEFSFILGATAFAMNMIVDYTYQLIISVISITLVISPIWIVIVRSILMRNKTVN
ncbi:MAG: cation:proton antiporter [Chitinophagales bacterium]|nr:cation:proton antiporter [Chitinophagales bacterium]